jgi:hypothetical protein
LILNKNKNKSSFWYSNKWSNQFFLKWLSKDSKILYAISQKFNHEKRLYLFLLFGWCFTEIILKLIIISWSNNLRFVVQLNQNWKDSFIV